MLKKNLSVNIYKHHFLDRIIQNYLDLTNNFRFSHKVNWHEH
jgi:hypothetical protein